MELVDHERVASLSSGVFSHEMLVVGREVIVAVFDRFLIGGRPDQQRNGGAHQGDDRANAERCAKPEYCADLPRQRIGNQPANMTEGELRCEQRRASTAARGTLKQLAPGRYRGGIAALG